MEENKMTVFISWSQDKSREIALILKEFLPDLFDQKITFWLSSVDISTGGISFSDIVEALQQSSMIIVCLDSSNYTKPWLYFETGTVFGRNHAQGGASSVLPIMFDNLCVSDFSGTPFSDLQLVNFTKGNMRKALDQINEAYFRKMGNWAISKQSLDRFFDTVWPAIYSKIDSIIKQRGVESSMRLSQSNVTELLEKHGGFPKPTIGDVIRYATGFETYSFYDFLLKNVTSRLYIFGRKNRKLSDSTLNEGFAALKDKQIDLRILFLNPASEYAKRGTPQAIEKFQERLILSLYDFVTRYEALNADISKDCRMYSVKRENEIIVADDIIFYKDVAFSPEGTPLHFTNGCFYVVPIDSQLGQMYYNQFNTVWHESAKTAVAPQSIKKLRAK